MEKETALPKNIRQIGDIQGKEKICIEDYVMTYIRKKEPQEEKGYLGIFLGEQKKSGETVYVFIRGILELSVAAQEGEKEAQLKERLKETFMKERVEYFPGWEVQGCCVIGAYRTQALELLSEILPEAGQMIYHLQEQEETLFWKERDQYSRIKGYFVFYEQNRKMQEYLAEVFKDDRVEKESPPDRAIKNFREKVREKSEKKAGSLLKLASSFFVVTVLVVGAVMVNRLDEIRKVKNAVAPDQGVLSDQTQQEGERLPAASYTAGDQAAGNITAKTETVQNNVQEGVGSPTEEGLQESIGSLAEEELQESAGSLTEEGLQESTGSLTGEGAGASGQSAVDAGSTEVQEAQPDVSAVGTGQSAVNAGSTEVQEVQADASAAEAGQPAASAGNAEIQEAQPDASAMENGQPSSDEENMDAQEQPNKKVRAVSSGAIHASYVIKAGDTLANICSKYYGSLDRIEEICDVNQITDANMIMPGQKIVLP